MNPPPTALPLVERESELASIAAAIAAAAAGRGGIVLVTGEPGAGKTSLVRAALADAAAAGTRVLLAACDDLLTSRTLGPFRDLADASAGPLRAAVQRPADREDLLEGLRHELSLRPHPTVLAIEDAHWADDATVDVLAWLARRIETLPALLLLTYRAEEIGATHALRRLLGRLAGVPVRRLPLDGLSQQALGTLTAGGPVDPANLFARTGGNPFFVTEILAHPTTDVPPTVADAVLTRIASLDDGTQQALQQLSVLPGGGSHRDVEELLPDPVAALSEAEAAGMVTVTADRVAFRHELARRALLESLPTPLVRRLHRRVLDGLLDRPDPDPSLLLHHADALDDRSVLIRFGPQAARDAAASGAHRQAVEHYRRVLRSEDAFDPADRADLLEGFAVELYLISDAQGSVDAQERAVALRAGLGDPVRYGKALRWLSRLLWYAGRDIPAEEVGAEALTVLADAGDPIQLAWAHSNLAQLAMLASRDTDAEPLAGTAVDLARSSGQPAVLAHALNTLGVVRWRNGDPGEGLRLLTESKQVALDHQLTEDVCRAYVNIAGAYMDDNDYVSAERVLADGLAYADQSEQLAFLRFQQANQATVLVETGQWPAALAVAGRALEGSSVASTALALSAVAKVRVRTGDDAADEVLRALAAEVKGADSLQRLLPDAVVRAEHAWLTGRAEQIPAIVEPVLAVAADREHSWALSELAYWLWKAGAVAPLLGDDSPFVRQLSGAPAQAAAEWAALGRPYDRARALLESGTPDDLSAALTIADDLGAAPLARMIRSAMRAVGLTRIPRGPGETARRNPFGLTARQLEILALLPGGMTNQDIAERLVLSVRTVDNHVAAVLDKLQVPTRRAAAARAVELGLVPG